MKIQHQLFTIRCQSNRFSFVENSNFSFFFFQFERICFQKENLEKFQNDFTHEYQTYQKRIEDKLKDVHQEFDKFLQTHESQMKLARLLDQEMTRIHQGENGTKTSGSCQELMEKTTDLMNAVSSMNVLILSNDVVKFKENLMSFLFYFSLQVKHLEQKRILLENYNNYQR